MKWSQRSDAGNFPIPGSRRNARFRCSTPLSLSSRYANRFPKDEEVPAMNENIDVNEVPPSADALRMAVLQKEMEKMDSERKAREIKELKLAEFTHDFMDNHVSEDEMAMVRRLVMNAVKDGKFEAMIYSFPSGFCTDSGRAINNSDPRWPETLQGKARELFQSYEELAKPRGYKLKAMVISFPGGIPGDIGFFLNWAPPAV